MLRELAKRDCDAVYTWAQGQEGLFAALDADVQAATTAVLAEHPKLIGAGKGRNAADPFVIALALAREGVVVTEEHRGSLSKPKIPVVCDCL